MKAGRTIQQKRKHFFFRLCHSKKKNILDKMVILSNEKNAFRQVEIPFIFSEEMDDFIYL